MKTIDLLYYHENQMEVVKQNKYKLQQQGFVKGYKDIYPDIYNIINDKKGVAYIRGNVSLKLMTILYDVIIVYIPPISKSLLEKRFYLKWEELIILCQHGIVIPIIGDAKNYTAKHFDDLFIKLPMKPYSLWARGLALLDVFGMDNALEIAKEVLPVDAISAEPSILKKWSKRYNSKDEEFLKYKIRNDVAVNYADLCIFGCREEAESLSVLPPKEIYNNLKLLNEVRTYPVLFGLESQANYNLEKLSSISTIPLRAQYYLPQALPENELEVLYRGIGIDVDNISVNDIISYHNDGLGKQLRTALSDFNDYCDTKINQNAALELSEVCNKAERFQKDLKSAINDLNCNDYYRKMDQSEKNLTKVLKIGTIAAGACIVVQPDTPSIISAATLVGTGVSMLGAIPESIARIIVKLTAQGLYPKFVANMWSAKKIVGGN